MTSNLFNPSIGARNYSISQAPSNNTVFSGTGATRLNPLRPYPVPTNSMLSLGRTSAIRIRSNNFQEIVENNKYEGAKSSGERIQYLKKLAQGSDKPTTTTISYVTNDGTNRNTINSAKRRTRNIGYRVPKKVGL